LILTAPESWILPESADEVFEKQERKHLMKKRKLTPYAQFYAQLCAAEQLELGRFFSGLYNRVLLPKKQKKAMRHDFEAAILVLVQSGVPLHEALGRLSLCRLGDFYSTAPSRWYPLDDAAKIYPLSMSHREIKMFRLSVYLTEPVVPELLQIALTFTIRRYPFFAATVKKGFFWHYIDSVRRRFTVSAENQLPFAPMDVSLSGSPSFRVMYFMNRISAEYFHILTDATGGIEFLKTLAGEYLRLRGVPLTYSALLADPAQPPQDEESANGFDRTTAAEQSSGFVDKPAVQMGGRLSAIRPCRILHFEMQSDALLQCARQRGVTVTALILALMFCAVRDATPKKRGRVQIQVPVNMRKYYPCKTLRNFSMYCSIRFPLEEIDSPETLLPKIREQLEEGASRRKMSEMMRAASAMVRSLRWVPLVVKQPFARVITGFLGDRVFTTTLSNLGVVKIPQEMAEHVRKMDFSLGGGMLNRASCAMVTTGNTAVLSVTKLTHDPAFEESLNRQLQGLGVPFCVTGSELI
jgi:hypothetical protein